jgi:cell division protein FtsX
VYIFSAIALLILLIAGINYMNLSTARSSLRAREIGIRKVSGAVRGALIRQFLTESVFISLLAAVVALVIAELLLPGINTITGKNLSLFSGGNLLIPLLTFGFAVLLGIVAGFYPALFLSSFEPIKMLKGEKLSGFKKFSLRKVLVVTQFTISIALIIGTMVVIKQISFIQNAKLGLNKDHVLMINDIGYLSRSERQKLQNDLQQITKIAYSMVTVYGMNEKVGRVSFYDPQQENSFTKPYSEETSKLIDEEVRKLIDVGYARTKSLLIEKKEQVRIVAEALLEREDLFQSDVEALIGKRPYEEKKVLDVPIVESIVEQAKPFEKPAEKSSNEGAEGAGSGMFPLPA